MYVSPEGVTQCCGKKTVLVESTGDEYCKGCKRLILNSSLAYLCKPERVKTFSEIRLTSWTEKRNITTHD